MKRATCTFFGPDNLVVVEGSLHDEKSPLVRARPDLFEDPEDAAARSVVPSFGPDVLAPVEMATAKPGAKRLTKGPDA